jgi:hypothetical protein
MLFELVKLTVDRFITYAESNKDLHKRECFPILSLQIIRVEDLKRGLVESIFNITFIYFQQFAKLMIKPCNVELIFMLILNLKVSCTNS